MRRSSKLLSWQNEYSRSDGDASSTLPSYITSLLQCVILVSLKYSLVNFRRHSAPRRSATHSEWWRIGKRSLIVAPLSSCLPNALLPHICPKISQKRKIQINLTLPIIWEGQVLRIGREGLRWSPSSRPVVASCIKPQ